MNRPILRDSFLSINFSGSKFFTSAANCTAKFEASKAVIGPTPLFPANSWLQTSAVVLPTPQISPTPVMTTRRFTRLLACLRVLLDVIDRVLNGLDLFGVFVGDFEIEGLFELHDELDHV